MLVIPLGWQPVDANGNPYAGALAYLYRTGTSTPQAGYSDSTLATPLSNPVVADSAGRFAAVYAGMVYDYKVVLKTAAGATIATYDPVGASSPGLSLSGHTGEVFATFDDTSNKFDLDVRNVAMSGDLTLTGASIVEAMGASVAGATTTNVWAGDGGTVHITGSGATITSLGTAPQAGARMLVIMDGAHTLTHGANLDLPGNVNRTTAAGDRFELLAETTSALRVVNYTPDGGIASDLGTVLTTQGDILIRGASAPERLAYGRSGKVLTTAGAAENPAWAAAGALAFVRFVGSTGTIVGTAFNVSSVTRNGSGDYTINFSPALPSANYTYNATGAVPPANSLCSMTVDGNTAPTATALRVFSILMNSGDPTLFRADPTQACVTIYDAT